MTTSVSAKEARRVFLHRQGLGRARPRKAVRPRDIAGYLERQGILQLDTVNVLARAHYMPLYSRLGPYDTAMADHALWGHESGHAENAFEHWGHEASVMPRDLLPLMHHRMAAGSSWQARTREGLEAERPGLIAAVLAAVEDAGPVTAGDIEHLAPRTGRKGPWWDSSHVKVALEYLFITGEVAASRGRHFARTYDSTQRAWGLPRASEGDWGVPADAARQALFDRALAAVGIGTPKDVCDHFRLSFQAGPRTRDVAGAKVWAASAVERGLATWVEVEGWGEPALVAADAVDPGRTTGAALLSPFDPACWYRPRLERMFGMDYRIEIYTPAAKRQYGYYCLPLLIGDQMAGRFDLKVDRKSGTLMVQAAWAQPHGAPGSRRLSDHTTARAAAAELRTLSRWLAAPHIVVASRGNLAPALHQAVGDTPGA
ncbi:winged helix-turn-helix domain-containing protein [Demequina globuliformis]|uniref:winged helix-turn-helix domain-containing protein n=1 Tax=Demequina globuliformis TaxID=676202 RepID=UPI0007853907|nr:crosslink repair DNA glycosylase YcaQ family protein [Demequina globuliformis]